MSLHVEALTTRFFASPVILSLVMSVDEKKRIKRFMILAPPKFKVILIRMLMRS